ncbi:MAG: hypothetical protein J6572_10685 [Gilliamella sp.]|nr:hypothetical protein [Lactobacillus sp.]MCO6555462.1 hypothetical protein [Gilliamella sp.]
MTEEKRIFNNGKYCAYFKNYGCNQFLMIHELDERHPKADPFTYDDLKSGVYGIGKIVVDIIGIDEFWDRYSKPVTEKKVPVNG